MNFNRKLDVYDMEWSLEMDQEKYIIAAARYAGPIGSSDNLITFYVLTYVYHLFTTFNCYPNTFYVTNGLPVIPSPISTIHHHSSPTF